MIVAHGNGTQASDASEANAFARVFRAEIPPITAFKWAIGHLIAASGLTELILALTALRQRVVPGIPTLNSLDPNLPALPVCVKPQKPRSDVALILCRGFAGMNVALVVRAK
jgi:3-oxoacyl-[acyl-carrier-protein] synthase-1